MAKTVLNDRYELGEEVGKGGMAITYRARDTLLNRTVAVKVMREQFGSDPAFIERFRREAQAAANLSHENIAGIYDTGADGGRHYIVMEFVEGENLEQRLRREGPLDPLAAIDIALQVVAALEVAHRRGIVHRDVKPHNVLINSEGKVKVTDFGIAKAISASSQTDTGLIIGSVHYFSPEQARGDPTGPQSDLYSLGVVLFEALTARRPFEGSNPVAVAHKQIYEQPPLPSEYRPDLPEEMESIVLRCLEKSLARRYATAAELKGYLENARERIISRMGGARGKAAPLRRRGRPLAWIGAVVAAAALAAGAYFLVSQRRPPQVVVPDLSGLDPTSAQRLLAESKLIYRAAPDGIYAQVGAGLIARQDPQALSRVEPSSTVTVWLSLGPRYAVVPDVANMSPQQAQRRLKEAGLEPGRIIEQYDDKIPQGYIVSSEPEAGGQVGKRTRVALIVSKGRPPSAWEPPEAGSEGGAEATIAYTVPDDVGAEQVQVRVEVTDSGGKRTLYDAMHMAGDQLPTLRVRYTGLALVRVLINGQERWRRSFGSEAPAEPEKAGGSTSAPGEGSPPAAPGSKSESAAPPSKP
jgi:serine/threonine-protein kinase